MVFKFSSEVEEIQKLKSISQRSEEDFPERISKQFNTYGINIYIKREEMEELIEFTTDENRFNKIVFSSLKDWDYHKEIKTIPNNDPLCAYLLDYAHGILIRRGYKTLTLWKIQQPEININIPENFWSHTLEEFDFSKIPKFICAANTVIRIFREDPIRLTSYNDEETTLLSSAYRICYHSGIRIGDTYTTHFIKNDSENSKIKIAVGDILRI